MAKPGRGARIKGASFERALAKLLSDATGYKFSRGLGQARRGGAEISDVYSDQLPQYHFEAKRQIKCNIKAAMIQALGDVETTNKIPIVVTKDDHGEILVTMQYKDWIEFFKKVIE